MSIPADGIDRELDAFAEIPDWGCPCGAEGPHEWLGFSVPRRGFWGMCSCKGGEPHLHMQIELIDKSIPFPSMAPRT